MKYFLATLSLLIFVNLYSQEQDKPFFEVVCDSVEFGDTVSYEDIKRIVQIKVYQNLKSGEQHECYILGGKIWVTGVVRNGEFLEGGKVKSTDCDYNANGCSILLQSRGKHVTLQVSILNKKGEERMTGISFKVPN